MYLAWAMHRRGEAAIMRVEGDSLFYDGGINEQSYDAFRQLISENPQVGNLVISSPGGDTKAGIAMAYIVHERNLDVTIRDLCFSSCANYVFPASGTKNISHGAIVGWHGSEAQFMVYAEQAGRGL